MRNRLWGSLLALILAFPAAAETAANDKPALPQIAAAARAPYVAILDWHDVTVGRDVWFDTPVEDFKTQMAAIARGGFHVIRMDALVDHLMRGTPLPPRPLVLTFDDNGSGIYAYAYPILKRYRFPATLFVHTAFVGVTTTKHHNTWPQLQEMARSGLISVQSLTVTHPPDLRSLSDAEISTQLRNSRAAIEKRTGKPVYAFVYPENNYDERVARVVAQNGYTIAFSENWGNAGASENLMMVHRYSILKRFDQALSDVTAAWSVKR